MHMDESRRFLPGFFRWLLLATALVGARGNLAAGTVLVDFATTSGTIGDGATPPAGWTYSSVGVSDGTAYFNARADFMVSPVFDAVVTNVSLVCRCSSAAAERLLRIVPLTVTAEGTTTNMVAAVCSPPLTEKNAWCVAFAPELGANAVLIDLTDSGTGNWALYSACVAHTGAEAPMPLGAPTGVRGEATASDAFALRWDAVAGATSYGVRVWQEDEAPPTGTASLYVVDFDAQVNEGGNPRSIDASLEEVFGVGWSGEALYVPAKTSGCVQMGTGKATGWLLSPGLGDSGTSAYTLAVRAKRYANAREGSVMPIDLVRGTTTNALATFTLGDDWAWHAASLEGLAAGDRLLFHSFTNGTGRRAWISDIQILSDYAPGAVTTNVVLDLTGCVATTKVVDRLSAGENYRFAVRAERDDERGPWSAPGGVVLPEPDEGDVPGEDAAPTGLVATHVATNALTVAWNPVVGATEYLVTVVTNVFVPEREGAELWRETFAGVPAMPSGEWPLETLRRLADWNNWDGTNIYAVEAAEPAVQLGNTTKRGVLKTGALGLEGTGYVLKFRAWKREGQNMPFEVVDDAGRTNWTTNVALGATPEFHRLVLPPLGDGDGLVFHSTTNAQQGRVCLGEMRILADDEPARTNVVKMVENLPVTDCAASFGALFPTVVRVQVAAVVAGVTNAGEWLEVDLAKAGQGAWRVSQFVGGVKAESCGWVTNVSQRMVWENGETLPGFHAFVNGEPVTAIGYDSGLAVAAGLYASSTNGEETSVHSLSLHASGDREVAVVLRIVNDSPTQKAVGGAELDFTAHQWSFPETGVRTMVAEWAATDGDVWPREEDWAAGDEEAVFASVSALAEDEVHHAAARRLRTGRCLVPACGCLWFRWRVARATGSPMFGVSDVRVRIDFLKDPSVLFLR